MDQETLDLMEVRVVISRIVHTLDSASNAPAYNDNPL